MIFDIVDIFARNLQSQPLYNAKYLNAKLGRQTRRFVWGYWILEGRDEKVAWCYSSLIIGCEACVCVCVVIEDYSVIHVGMQNCLYQLMFSGCVLSDATACMYICMQQLVLYRCEVSEGPWAIVGMPFLMIMKMWIWCRTMMMLMRAVLMMMMMLLRMLLRMLLVIAVDGIYDQNCHVNSHHSGHSICRGHCAGICTWPTVAAWRHEASGGSPL